MQSAPAVTLDSDTSRGQRHALPAWVYGHPELTRLETERVLLPSWQIVCHVNSIPRAGDYETFDLGSESVFVLRDQDGSLIGVPMRESFPNLDRAAHGLCPVRVDTALGFVFVCLAGDPPPVAKTWGKLGEELAPYRLQEMVPLAPISTDV